MVCEVQTATNENLCLTFLVSQSSAHETQAPGFHPAQELHGDISASLRFYVSDYPLLWFWMDRAIQASTFLELGNPSFGGSLQFPKNIITPKKYCRGLDREVTGSTNPYNIQQPSNLIRWGVS